MGPDISQPAKDDREVFERQCFVIFASGLSVNLLIGKWQGIKQALSEFDIEAVAAFHEPEITALMDDPRVIRNAAKLRAITKNAQTMLSISAEHGSFQAYLNSVKAAGGEAAMVAAVQKRFAFLGKSTTVMFLRGIGEPMTESLADCDRVSRS